MIRDLTFTISLHEYKSGIGVVESAERLTMAPDCDGDGVPLILLSFGANHGRWLVDANGLELAATALRKFQESQK